MRDLQIKITLAILVGCLLVGAFKVILEKPPRAYYEGPYPSQAFGN